MRARSGALFKKIFSLARVIETGVRSESSAT
jgi:hypothetical protein